MIGLPSRLLAPAISIGGTLVLGVIISLAAWGSHLRLELANAALASQTQKAKDAQAAADRNLENLNILKSILDTERAGQAKLLAVQGQQRQALADRQHLIVSLTNENEKLRQWVIQPLPDTARRLRERPALTGADAYREWLSSGRAVHTPGDESE